MAKVLLFKAAYLRSYNPSMVPPLGLLYLAAVLRRQEEHEPAVMDLRLCADWRVSARQALEALQPDIVGISALTFERQAAAQLASLVRGWRPGVPVILGGPHASALPREALAQAHADAVVVGEGEGVILPLVEALLARRTPELQGVVTPATPPEQPIQPAPPANLDDLPLPAWDLVDLDAYARHQSMCTLSPWRYAVINTTRGCPWHCTYCHSLQGKKLRKRSIQSISEELEILGSRLGSGAIEIIDDSFNADPDHAKHVLEVFAQKHKNLSPAFPNGLRADRIDDELLDLFASSRTRFISMAIESANDEIQRRIRKNLDLDSARKALEGAATRGLYTNGLFMLGFPDETLAQMWETIRWSIQVPLVQALFFRVVPMPGSQLWHLLDRRDQLCLAGIDDYFLTRANLSAVSDTSLAWVYRLAYLAFYGRPTQILRFLHSHPAPLHRIPAALKMLSGNAGGPSYRKESRG